MHQLLSRCFAPRSWALGAVLGAALIATACGAETPPAAPTSTSTPAAAGTSAAASATPSATPAAFPVTVKDGTGAEITAQKAVTRIACASGPCADVLSELGIKPVAMHTSYVPLAVLVFGAEANSFPKIGGTFSEPNVEDIALAKPELVLGLAGAQEGIREALKPIAPYHLANLVTYQDSINYVRDIGRLTGKTAEAERAIDRFQKKLAAYREKSPKDVTVLALYGTGTANYNVWTQTSAVGSVLAEVAKYPWQAPPQASGFASTGMKVALDQILVTDPEVIFTQPAVVANPQPFAPQLATLPVWGQLKAVKNQRVYEVTPPANQYWGTGRGTRSLTAVLDEIMPKLYPQVFPTALP